MDHDLVPVPRAQQALWLADQLTQGTAVYLSNTFLRLAGPLDTDRLARALRAVVTRHEVLRTSILPRDGEVVGRVRPPEAFALEVSDVDEAGLAVAMGAESATPVDVSEGLPIRARLLRLAPDDHVLCLAVHHLAYDRGSVQIFYRDLARHYNDPAAGVAPVRSFREAGLADDARQDAGELAPMVRERCAALADLTPFELPADRSRPAVRGGAGALRHGFALPPVTAERLAELGREQAASLYMVLLAACQAVLYRYTGRADVSTGTSSSTRRDPDVVGPFFNMLVIPGDVSGNPTFADLVRRVRDTTLDAYEARWVGFDTLVNELRVPRDPARTPLFQILVDLTTPVALPALSGLAVTEILTPGAGAKYDLTLEFRHEEGAVGWSVEWDTELYETATVLRLMAHLRAVLVAVAGDPSLRVDDVPMLSPDEIEAARAYAEPDPEPLPDRCLHELFTDQVARTPGAVAVRDGDTAWTYAELDARTTAIARGLVARGVGPDVPVGILLDRSADLVAAVLGVLKAGGAYVPLDPEAPPARTEALLRRSGAPVCIAPTASGSRAVDVGTLMEGGAGHELPGVRPDHMCAVYFTSGSTGEPKGVQSTHRGWVSQMLNMHRRYRLAPDEPVLLKTPLSFDDVAREIFWPLMVGGRIEVLGPGLHRDPRALLRAAADHRLVWLQFVPSMLVAFLEEIGPDDAERLRHLRHVVSDGDRLRPATVRAFHERLGRFGCQLNNHWGTTEVSIDSTHHVCTAADADGGDAVTLGRPMEHHTVHLLDATLQPVPHGAVGELCIGGVGLARGYLGDPGRTARAFVPHPWRPGERLYRTGDTGRLRPDGRLEYRGRRDHQVKVRGVRIELGEVEAAVRAFPGVTDAVVTTWDPAPGDRRLVAYAAIPGAGAEARAGLRDHLADRLAPAAVPSVVTVLPDLPRNPSGKVDRRSLPPPDPGELAGAPFTPPATDTEQALADLWAGVLGATRLGADDDFFASGGHSLLVTRAVNRMREAFAVDVPVRFVFEHPTVRRAAARLEELIVAEIEAMSDATAERLAAAEPTGPQERVDVS
ncbi:non-ribosomal peptide synthetase [Phytohabitans sp. LJ34]|uniref:non-ribosomal peptide synthetase n=1 Tax=Phytohabitans sp. LJ34 TaxID=3452217 RepID=UPI003F8C5EB9